MAEITYKQFGQHVEGCRKSGFASVYLVFGEEFLCTRTVDALVKELLPSENDRTMAFDAIDTGEGEGVYDAVERLNTFSFFGGKKVVLLKSASLFSSTFDADKQMTKIRAAYDSQSWPKACRLLIELADRQGCRIEDFSGIASADIARSLKVDPDKYPDLAFIQEIVRQCDAEGTAKSRGSDDASILKAAIDKGFPKNHHLIIVTENVDKRTSLYKAVKSQETAINCQVPKGNRKADRDEQRRVLSQLAKEMLSYSGKSIEPSAFDRIFQLTGFDPRHFLKNLEKMVHYVAEQPRITVDDVAAVLDQSREDPIYLFTGAIADRNIDSALYYLSSLLSSGFHYMQLLSAMINQIRKMVAVRGFIDSRDGNFWKRAMSYDQFRDKVMPAVSRYDAALQDHVQELASGLAPKDGKGKPSKTVTDFLVAKNPNNPYPVYQSFTQAEHFDTDELLAALQVLHEADVRLKTSGQSPRAVLESVIFNICRKTAA